MTKRAGQIIFAPVLAVAVLVSCTKVHEGGDPAQRTHYADEMNQDRGTGCRGPRMRRVGKALLTMAE
jgi:hypothetical protein